MNRNNFALSSEQKADARAAMALLEGTGLSLTEAARRSIDKMRAIRKVTVAECSDEFQRTKLKKRGHTAIWYENKLGRLTEIFGGRDMDAVSRVDFRAWIAGAAVSDSTRASYTRAARALWNWAIAQEPPMAGLDPTAGLPVTPPPKTENKFLTVDECAKIMEGGGEYTAAFALMLFAGVRPHEIAGKGKPALPWRSVNQEDKIIRVESAVSKTGHPRTMEGLPPAVWRWVGKRGQDGDPVSQVLAPALIERAALLAGYGDRDKRLKKWPHDGLRHTFATYAVSLTSDPGKVSLWLGHEGKPTLLYRHYRGLTTKSEAERFWALRPKA